MKLPVNQTKREVIEGNRPLINSVDKYDLKLINLETDVTHMLSNQNKVAL